MAKAPPSFDFYFNDWIGGVQDLGAEDERHYLRLLIYQWQNGFLPKSKIGQMNVCGVSDLGLWDAIWGRIAHKFVEIADKDAENGTILVQDRMYRDRPYAVAKWLKNIELREIRRAAGLKGGRPKSKTKAKAKAKPKQTKANLEGGSKKDLLLDLRKTVSSSMLESVESWLEYKAERRESYRPQGMKAFITQIAKAEKAHGAAAVVDALQVAMANGWKGWQVKLDKIGSNNKQKTFDEIRLERTAEVVRKFGNE